ncbi:Serine threonine- kinase MHK [Olea europaea subsp. europaea]|uniref:Serine threonine- kinase MHK n=1 Tax=Olea europaea subsp. europaea TaxID=158383 RepID=A0A8S0RH81_OLEEU|nr:Serine threonine- kinase MHK [Olea europaea subsp. europaea]
MGFTIAEEEEESPEQEFPHESVIPSFFSGDENGSVISGESVWDFIEFSPEYCLVCSSFDAAEMQRRKVYAEVLRSYEELRLRAERLEEAKSKILSYTPGSWIEKVAGTDLSDYDVPKTTTLLLIGPKGSGKSSLVNKISRVLEDDEFATDRAQVSYNVSTGDGTYFLQEYLIPRGSGSFCLYDTRSLSNDSSENLKMIKRWMTKGVHCGELVKRNSDCPNLKGQLKHKAQKSRHDPSKVRKINFVIFVVNGLTILESMDVDDETAKSYTDMVATTFNNPLLSFRDDKPVIVVTHGDLLSLCDRVRVRVHLGKLLGVPPTRQIFDIPESNDSAVALTVVDMLRYSLEHADRNLPGKVQFLRKMYKSSIPAYLLLLLVLGIAIVHQIHGTNFKSRALKVHLDEVTGSIPNKIKGTGEANFHSHSSEIHLDEATGSIPNKGKQTGEANFHCHSSKIHLDEETGSGPNKRMESGGANFHSHASDIHLNEATGLIPSQRKETTPNKINESGGANFHSHSSNTHLDETTGSIPNERKETVPNKRKETQRADVSSKIHLDWRATRHLWLDSDDE